MVDEEVWARLFGMKLYVLIYDDRDRDGGIVTLIGIFSSERKAQLEIENQIIEDCKSRNFSLKEKDYFRRFYEVREYQLDKVEP